MLKIYLVFTEMFYNETEGFIIELHVKELKNGFDDKEILKDISFTF